MLAPFTPVHPQETTATPPPPEPAGPDLHEGYALALSFRHSFWQSRRHRTYSALSSAFPSSSRLSRFESCGEGAWIQKSRTTPPRYRIRSSHCKDRFCEACSREKRNLVASNLYRNLSDRPLRLLTLTLKSNCTPLRSQISRLYKCFAKFRNASKITKILRGGVYFFEITYNAKIRMWHPHLHVIFEGGYLPADLARSTWLSITGDSYVLDIRFIRNVKLAASYVTKYAAKCINASVWSEPRALDEAIRALERSRTFNTFGSWRSLHLTRPPDDDTEWVDLAPLSTTLIQAKSGDPIAADLIRQLRRFADTVDGPPPPDS